MIPRKGIKKIIATSLLVGAIAVSSSLGCGVKEQPTPTITPTPIVTVSSTPIITATPTPKQTVAPTVSTKPTPTITPSPTPTPTPTPSPSLETELYGLCYGPYRDNENPDKGVYPTIQELEEDLNFVPKITSKIRTYGVDKTLYYIPEICDKLNIDCYPGAWLDKSEYECENENSIENLIKIAQSGNDNVKGVVVGNEVVLSGSLTDQQLSDYIKRVNDATKTPVGTAEEWTTLLKHKNIADNADFIFVHIYPYSDGVDINKAAQYVIDTYYKVKDSFPGKEVMIGETGWPTAGNTKGAAVPSEENQKKFLTDFTKLAKENNVPYFYFELFDENWKVIKEGEVGAHWGLYETDGSLKKSLIGILPEGIVRPPRLVEKVPVNAPVIVYTDVCSDDNHFQPSGWMHDLKSITLQRDYKINPYSGNSCTKITYSPTSSDSWAGVYWQYPINNWGNYPGYQISGATKITFLARGENGGEKAEFKSGGIKTPPYPDSYGPVGTGIIELTKEWKKYEINLVGQNLNNVIGGFCWITNINENPTGCTIYVDEIKFE
jgi:exo-beta-1,3-glucanase (GH17 family)